MLDEFSGQHAFEHKVRRGADDGGRGNRFAVFERNADCRAVAGLMITTDVMVAEAPRDAESAPGLGDRGMM